MKTIKQPFAEEKIMKKHRIWGVLLAAVMALTSVPVFAEEPADLSGTSHLSYGTDSYRRADDDLAYALALGEYKALMVRARDETDPDTRFVRFAKAEAALLDSGAVLPATTQGGSWSISRVVPHTVNTTRWGNDSKRRYRSLVTNELIKNEDRDALKALWEANRGKGTYEAAARQYILEKGYTLREASEALYSVRPETWDVLATYAASDNEFFVNTFDGLLEYDPENVQRPALAESYEVSPDGLEYTFHIREGVKWVDADGSVVGEVTADDWVAGMQHTLDLQYKGMGNLICGDGASIQNAGEYRDFGTEDFSGVGVKARDAYTLCYTLEEPCPYFLTLFGYGLFAPLNREYFLSRGGAFGREAFENAEASEAYVYGKDYRNILYCGPYLAAAAEEGGDITFTANPHYWNKEAVNLASIVYHYQEGGDPQRAYRDTAAGALDGVSLNAETMKQAREEGLFDTYAYIGETDGATFFDSLNLNRGTFALDADGEVKAASPKSEKEKISAAAALSNQAFRQALCYSLDRAEANAHSMGEELKLNNLRNTLVPYDFAYLSKEVTVDGERFEKGSWYGELVQYFLAQKGSPVTTLEGQDGWHHPEKAREKLSQAKIELGSSVTWPVRIDFVYLQDGNVLENRAKSYKASLEGTLGKENVVVNLVATDSPGFLASCYFPEHGYDVNSDFTDINGWGPDYGDPLTYLSAFEMPFGYLLKSLGVSEFDGKYADGITVTKQPAAAAKKAGEIASFTAEAFSSLGIASCLWQYRVSPTASWKSVPSGSGDYSGRTTKTLKVKATAAKDGYQFRLRVKNSAGAAAYTKAASLTVPAVLTNPKAVSANLDKTASFTVKASGSGRTYRWQYYDSASSAWKNLATSVSGYNKATLSVKATESRSGMKFRCRVTAGGVSVYSASAKLTVVFPSPRIDTQPKDVSVLSGKTAKFSVKASGTGLKYLWYVKKSAAAKYTKISSAKKSAYSIKAKKSYNGYMFCCVVTNKYGKSVTSKKVKLTVK